MTRRPIGNELKITEHPCTYMQSVDVSVRMLRNTALAMALSVSALAVATSLSAPSGAEEASVPKPVAPLQKSPFAISVDGVPVAGSPAVGIEGSAASDEVDVKVKFDGLDSKPILNVSTVPPYRSFLAGERIEFLASCNYPDWIARMELRILPGDTRTREKPLDVIDVPRNGKVSWTMPEQAPDEMFYVLRVYGEDGSFDETVPLSLLRSDEVLAAHTAGDAPAAGTAEDRTAFRNINVHGGAVTVYGSNIPAGRRVIVFGTTIPVDPEGRFVTQHILPPGDHDVDVEVSDQNGEGLSFGRSVNIPDNDWFYVGMADVTAGERSGSKGIEAVKDGEFDNLYTKGRLAFYLKGKIKGRYLLTASADTREGPLADIFSGLDAKDARQFLRRIDPEAYYPVYGDDSSAYEDAPTRGKFYVRLERGDSYVMWGNFKADITGTEFLRNERALYGASLAYRPDATTGFGARRTKVTGYVSQPGTLPQRDVLRGTGGSAYFLKQQDITRGSETITIEIHDRVTGRVLERRTLQYGQDYDINYIQGVLLLREPLPSSSGTGDAVDSGGNPAYVVANYEYTPATGDVDGYTFGGRGQQWLGENLRLGVTGMTEKTGSADQQLAGADILLRHSENTFLEAEVAQSSGPGIGSSYSADGGLDISDTPSTGIKGQTANAYRMRGKADLGELTADKFKGSLEAYAETYGSHFSSAERRIDDSETSWGLRSSIALSDSSTADAHYDECRVDGDGLRRQGVVQSSIAMGEDWTLTPGLTLSETDGAADDNGRRLDGGAKLAYAWSDSKQAYVRAQATVERSGKRDRNDRVGIGGKRPLTDKVSLEGEVSYGTSGIGAIALLDYAPSADDHYYAGYRLVPSEDDIGSSLAKFDEELGVIVAGTKRRISDKLSAFAENRGTPIGDRRTLIQSYGVTYTPDSLWTLTGGIESGLIFGDTTVPGTQDIERTAVSSHASYHSESGATLRGGAEFRDDSAKDGSFGSQSYLLTGGFKLDISDDWRFIAQGDAAFTDATDTTRDGDYIESSVGFAYRPVGNDRLNALFKYVYLYDLPGADQVTFDGSRDGPQQQTHILSADASYDFVPQLTLGAKYGLRYGQTRARDGTGGWSDAVAQLGILRADLHVVNNWDVMLEGRTLWTGAAETADYGLVAGVFRHLGENIKVGGGYNFGRFSDDLRDHTFDDRGWFVNVLAKF